MRDSQDTPCKEEIGGSLGGEKVANAYERDEVDYPTSLSVSKLGKQLAKEVKQA